MPQDIVIETDIGRDADDFFALCYLLAAGVNVRSIVVSPGDKDQIAVAKFLLDKVGLYGVPVGSAKPDREKSSVGGMHPHLLKKHKWPERMQPDGFGPDVLKSAFGLYPNAELFCIGPLQSVGPYLMTNPDRTVSRSVMQGGFAGYHLHSPTVRLPKFEGLVTCPTFNLGGDKRSALHYVSTAQIKSKMFVGKNVCHSVVYTPEQLVDHQKVAAEGVTKSTAVAEAAYRLFLEAMQLFFDLGAPHKAFHDPLAACLMLHPEIGTWIDGAVYYEKGEWGTKVDTPVRDAPQGAIADDLFTAGPHKVLVDVNREAFWQHVYAGV